MERLEREKPAVKLSERQLEELRELDRVYDAKEAERRVFLDGRVREAEAAGQGEAAESARRQLVADLANLKDEREAKRRRIRGDS